jgi:1,4-alpha-glucan branching enzyme
MSSRGELAIVLHTHMPYVEGGGAWPPREIADHMETHGVDFETALRANPASLRDPEGFGTWPFGEEWLWEAIATSYLPLLDVLGRAPITLSLTPVLCDQLEAPGAIERCIQFLREVRPESHRRDREQFRRQGQADLVAELDRSASQYEAAAEQLEQLPDGLLSGLSKHVSWTSSATHAVLPLMASESAVALQVQTGIASHRRRFGEWAGGFWLPECAHVPWLDQLLGEAGVRATCVELTSLFGLGDARMLRPLLADEGPLLWPIDRQTMSLVWSDAGYPASPQYRNYHALTPHHHRVWRNDGAPYDPRAAGALLAEHAADFVGRVRERVAAGGICVCALDTELLGHWWHEGVQWLAAVLDQAALQQLRLTTLDDALERYEPVPAPPGLATTSWGEGGDLRTWSAPPVADLAWRTRTAELRVLAAPRPVSERAMRELLALQSSDWAFLAYRQLAGDYPRERAQAHRAVLERALDPGAAVESTIRNLAPELTGWEG